MTTSITAYQVSIERQLRSRLSQLSTLRKHGKLTMQCNNADLGFTENPEIHSTLYMTTGSFYHPVGSIGDKTIIVYVSEGSNSGFGLYNEGDPEETCFPISIREVVATWTDEPVHIQKGQLSRLRDIVIEIIDRSTV